MMLTDEEQNHIERRRVIAAEVRKSRKLRVHFLRVAADYGAWLEDTHNESTFSAFLNDFGYEADPELCSDYHPIYQRVIKLIEIAGE